MEHTFDSEIAKDVGLIPAVLFHHIQFWIITSEANGENFFDGQHWTYSSLKALQTIFDYLTPWQIRSSIEKLCEAEYLVKGNYSVGSKTKSIWFSLGKKGTRPCGIPQDTCGKPHSTPRYVSNTSVNTDSIRKKPIDNTNVLSSCFLNARDARACVCEGENYQDVKQRINALFHRRDTTAWSDKETAQLKKVASRPEINSELEVVEKWHATPHGKQYGRHDVITLLNNFSSEVDRARAHIASPAQGAAQRVGIDGKPLNATNDPRNRLAFAGGHFSGQHDKPTTEMNF